ncbi:hypothetical protein [Octadecabacter antarcticus]|uniref:hypothetical protein n=1 Tax=Octadecabacter antarcticus TaxID=1217908 RepID=UPI001650FA8F|nr:hypothetical protein [Octadecabacter antarcticus]
MIEARAASGRPLIIGATGTYGTNSAVDCLYIITLKILSDLGQMAKIARLYNEQDPHQIVQTPLTPLSAAPHVDPDTIQSCPHIVALAGADQIQTALNKGTGWAPSVTELDISNPFILANTTQILPRQPNQRFTNGAPMITKTIRTK